MNKLPIQFNPDWVPSPAMIDAFSAPYNEPPKMIANSLSNDLGKALSRIAFEARLDHVMSITAWERYVGLTGFFDTSPLSP